MNTTTFVGSPANRVVASRVSWGAVFAGLLLSLATYLFLGVLGTAIGAASIDPLTERNPLSGFGSGAGIWVGLSTLIALAVGAFFAGRTAVGKGMLHGVLAWALTTLVAVYLVSSLAGSAIGAAGRVAGSGLSLAGQGVAAAAPGLASGVQNQLQQNGVSFDFNDARNQLETLLKQSGKAELDPERLKAQAGAAASDGKATGEAAATTPQTADTDIAGFFDRLRQRAQPGLQAADKDALVNIIVARTGKSRPEAEQIAANYEQTYNQAVAKWQQLKVEAEQKAREAGDAAAKAVSKAAWAGVFVMLLGFVVSAVAGVLGRRSGAKHDAVVAV